MPSHTYTCVHPPINCRPEILSLLPPYAGTRILELASGIGRFTGSLAQVAASVVTVEFMNDFLEKVRSGEEKQAKAQAKQREASKATQSQATWSKAKQAKQSKQSKAKQIKQSSAKQRSAKLSKLSKAEQSKPKQSSANLS